MARSLARFTATVRRVVDVLVAWRWLVVVDLFLVSPVLLHNLDLRSGGRIDAAGLWNLATSCLLLGGVQVWMRRPARSLVALAPFAVVVAADLFLVLTLDSRLTATYLAVIVHNLQDTGDFVQTFLPRLAAVAGLLPLYAYAAWRLRGAELPLRRAWGAAALGAAAALYATAAAWHVRHGFAPHLALYHVMVRDTGSPFGVIPQGAIALGSFLRAADDLEAAKRFRFDATRSDDVDAPEVYVLVIGETCRPDHWALNGYPRDTSPRLARTAGLVSFSNMVSQAPFTSESVPLMITRATAADRLRAARERSIVSAFAEAGFRTAWFSGHELGEFGGRINHFAAEAHVVRFFERRHDEVFVAPFAALLDEVTGPDDKLFVVLHTMGSHFLYENRVPEGFRRFSRLPAASRRERLVNAYDDTIRYTDHVLAELIARLEARPDVTSALLYVSDHGENLMDDALGLMGHGRGSRWDLPVASFFWAGPAFAARRPDAVACARARAAAPLSTAYVFDSLADLGDLAGPAFDRTRSIFSPTFVPRPRLFLDDGEVLDFDLVFGARDARLARESSPLASPSAD